ncbi:hypothetical protein [Rhizobium ruizarguesonis]
MTTRINTTAAEGESTVWAIPAGTVIQVGGLKGSKATVELWARADQSADFAYVGRAKLASQSFIAVDVALLEAKLKWHSNREGDMLKAWSV